MWSPEDEEIGGGRFGRVISIEKSKPDPFHAGRPPLEKHYIRTMENIGSRVEVGSDEWVIMRTDKAISSQPFTRKDVFGFIGGELKTFNTAIASLIAKGLVREVEITLK